MIQEPCWPLRFSHQQLPVGYFADPTLAEQPLFARALDGEAVAHLAGPAGVCGAGKLPEICRTPAVSEQFAGQGWPVWQRRSAAAGAAGAGNCQSQPGLAGLSLAGRSRRPIYLFLCGLLQRTLATFGVASHCRAVSGSFCDGRYNLACGEGEQVRKIAGTAQYWRPMAEGRGHVVLAHAVVLLDADLAAAHRAANDFRSPAAAGANTAPIKP